MAIHDVISTATPTCNVVKIAPSRAALRKSSRAETETLMAEVIELLRDTSDSLLNTDDPDRVSACHRTCVERTKQLLESICDSHDDDLSSKALRALGIVEIASVAVRVGPSHFKSSWRSSYATSVSEVLDAVIALLESKEEVANG